MTRSDFGKVVDAVLFRDGYHANMKNHWCRLSKLVVVGIMVHVINRLVHYIWVVIMELDFTSPCFL